MTNLKVGGSTACALVFAFSGSVLNEVRAFPKWPTMRATAWNMLRRREPRDRVLSVLSVWGAIDDFESVIFSSKYLAIDTKMLISLKTVVFDFVSWLTGFYVLLFALVMSLLFLLQNFFLSIFLTLTQVHFPLNRPVLYNMI